MRQRILRLVQTNCRFANVKEYEVLRLVCYECSKVAAHNAVPSWAVFLVKVRFNVLGDVLLFGVGFQSSSHYRHRVVLKYDKSYK